MQVLNFSFPFGESFIVAGAEEGFLRTRPRELSVVVDIGAHVGTVAILAAKLGAKLVYAVEPRPETYQLLVQNIRQNKVDDVVVPLSVAITGNREGKILLYSNDGNTGQHGVHPAKRNATNVYTVPGLPLENLLRLTDKTIDYLKMDIEGGEYSVFYKPKRSVTQELKKKIRYIFIELHYPLPPEKSWGVEGLITPEHLQYYLEGCGFDLEPEYHKNKKLSVLKGFNKKLK